MSRLFASTSTVKSHRGRRSLGDRAARGAALFVALLMVTIGVPTVLTQASASATERVTPAANPDLAASCGLDVVLVLDASGSIHTANAEADVKSAANTFLDAFKDTNTRVGIVKFSTTAATPLALTTVTTASTSAGGVHRQAIDSYNASGRTNWQDALLKAKGVFTSASPVRSVPKLVVFVTDGAPNTTNSGGGTTNHSDASVSAVDPAVTEMNAIKALGAHSLVVGAGQAFNDTSPSNSRINALYRVSQYPTPKIYPATPFDAATTDLILQKDFSALKDTLREVANQICDGILTVTKYASSADAPNTFVKQGAGWPFTTTVNPAGDWLKPTSGSGASRSADTDAAGTALFQWNSNTANWSKTATVTDTGKTNYTPDRAECSVNGGQYANVALSGKDFTVNVGAGKQVACKVYNKFTGPANTDVGITKTVSSSQVVVGDTVTWTLKAQNYGPNAATNVKFTDTVPAGLGPVSNVTASAGSFDSATRVWTIPTLNVGAGNAQTLTFTTTVTTTGDHLNKVALTSLTENDTNSSNDKSEANVKGVKADVTVTKSAGVASQVVGGNVEWTITATNNGPATAANVKVVDTLGADLIYVSDNGGGAYNPATKTWTIGTLTSGQSTTLKITTQGTAPGVKSNDVVISTSTPESNTYNNEATATVKFTISDVVVDKSVSNSDVELGQNVEWTIAVTNNGDATAKDVVVTDTLPAGLTLVSTNPAGALVGNTWIVGDLAPGETKMLELTTTVNSLTPITNEACATTSTPQSSTSNDCDDATVTATAADVSVTKVPDLSEVYINGTVEWTIKVVNTGKADAANVVVTDLAPEGLTLGSGTASQGVYGSGTWTVGTVNGTVSSPPNGGSATLVLSSTVGTTLGLLTNKVTVTTSTPETDTTNNTGEGTTNVTAADVTVTKVASAEKVYLGETVVWTITATNNGPATAKDVVVTDAVPAGLQVTDVAPSGALVGNTWAVGTLTNGQSKVLTITTKATALGEITNSALVTTSTPETDTTNNDAQDTICVVATDVTITKLPNKSVVGLGDEVTWSVVVTNLGTATAKDVVVTDVLPAGLELVSVAPAGALVGDTWTVGELAPGQEREILITTKTTQTGFITNSVEVTTSTPETNEDNNTCDATIKVKAPNLEITKDADVEQQYLGGQVVWTVTVSNTGNWPAQGVVVTDVVPASLQVVSTDPADALVDNAWSIGELAAGESRTLTITTTTLQTGDLTNEACVDTTSPQVENGPRCDEDTVTVTRDVKLSIVKTQSESTPNPIKVGAPVKYDIAMTNSGKSPADDVRFTDALPAGLQYDSATGTDWTCVNAGQDVTCTYGPELAAGATTPAVTITAIVGPELLQSDPVTNVACVTSGEGSEVPNRESIAVGQTDGLCDEATTEFPKGDLKVEKTNTPDAGTTLGFGDTITYNLKVTAEGELDQTGVVVTDDIPGYGSNAGSTPTTYVAGSAACIEPPAATPANCGIVPTSTDGKVTSLTWNLGDLAHGQSREVTFKVTVDVAPSNPEGNGDSVTVLNAGSVKSNEIPDKPSNEVENPVQVVTAVGDSAATCIDDTPRFNFESDGWFANEVVTLHILDKNGNEVETRQLTSDANGTISASELWPGYSQDPVTGVKTYPGLDVRPMKFFLTGSPQTPTVTVNYPPASAKCDAGIEISKSNEPSGTVEVGDTITYRITVKVPSNASFNQDGVVVSDYIPGYAPGTESGTTTYVAGSATCEGDLLPDVGKCDVSLDKNGNGKVTKVTWNLGSMKAGQSLDMVFKVTVDAQSDADTETVDLLNAAVVESAYWPATPSNEVKNTVDLVGVEGTKTPGGVLAATGTDVFRMLSIALSLLVVGGFLLRSTRRREELGRR